MRQRDCAHKIAKRSGSQHDWDAYKKLRNTVTKKIRTTKSEYFTSTIEDNKSNSSMLWKKLKGVLPNKKKITPNSILSANGENIDDLADIADTFNEHFSTMGNVYVVMPPLVILKYTTISIHFFITQSMSNACCPT